MVSSLKTPKSEPTRQQHCKKAIAAENMAAKAAMANATPNYFSAEAMGFILAALFFNTLTAPVVKMTQNAEGGYDYNKWCIYFFAELMKLGVALAWCFKAYQENDQNVVKHFNVDRSDFCLLYTSPSPRDAHESRMPSSA